MSVQKTDFQDFEILVPQQNLDSAENLKEFLEAFNELVDTDVPNIALDFHNVEYIPSSVIGMIISAYKNCRRLGGQLVLISVGPKLETLIEAAGVKGLFKVIKKKEELADLKKDK